MIKYMARFFLIIFLLLSFPVHAFELEHQRLIDEFYLKREGEPLWMSGVVLSKDGQTALETLKNAWQHGLNPQKYHVQTVERIIEENTFNGTLDPEHFIDLELLLTDGVVRYIQDLSGMRVVARDLDLNLSDWRQRKPYVDTLEMLLNVPNMGTFFEAHEPRSQTYQKMKQALIEIISSGSYKNTLTRLDINEVLLPGRGYDLIPALRKRFNLAEPYPERRFMFDDALVKAVKDFQRQNDLKADGVIGKQTARELNQNPANQVKQLTANMERLRWLPEKKPDEFIIVNVAASVLWAIRDGTVQFEMPVVIGRPDRQTTMFVTDIHGVRVHPDWTIPPTVKRLDILPKLQENPNYLADKSVELFDGYSKDASTLDPSVIDWQTISGEKLQNLRMVQKAGVHNPLGRFRVLMPNPYAIFLHDTNDSSQFRRADRALSSGCIRLPEPRRIAQFILQNKDGWSDSDLDAALASGEKKDIYINRKIPVYLLYYSVWVGQNQKLIYGDDLYHRDKKLIQALQKIDEMPILD